MTKPACRQAGPNAQNQFKLVIGAWEFLLWHDLFLLLAE